jgi:hypothetical protein
MKTIAIAEFAPRRETVTVKEASDGTARIIGGGYRSNAIHKSATAAMVKVRCDRRWNGWAVQS